MAAAFILGVELHGESFWLKLLLVLVPAVILGAAAWKAAMIAKASAFERQREQLAHDTARQEAALAHDRQMRDRESTRLAVDAAMKTLADVIKVFSELEVAVNHLQKVIDDPAEKEEEMRKRAEAVEGLQAAYPVIAEFGFQNVRLASRPGIETIAALYDEAGLGYDRQRKLLANGMRAKLTEEQAAELQRTDKEVTRKVGLVHAAWRDWLGA